MQYKNIKRKFDLARNYRETWNSTFSECYRYAMPWKTYSFAGADTNKEKNNHILFDDTAIIGTAAAADRIKNTLFPSSRKWFNLVPGRELSQDPYQSKKFREIYEKITDRMFGYLWTSNFDIELTKSLNDLMISTGALYIEQGTEDNPFNFKSVPLWQISFLEDSFGKVSDVFYEYLMTVSEIEERYNHVVNRTDKNQEEQLLSATLYDIKSDQFIQYIIHEEKIIFEQKFETNPWIIFRWSRTSGDHYGIGPLIKLLPTIRVANGYARFIEETLNTSMKNNYLWDPLAFSEDIHFQSAQSYPINEKYKKPIDQAIYRIPSPENRVITEHELLREAQEKIKNALLYYRLDPTKTPTKTATEVAINHNEFQKQESGAYASLHTELGDALIARCFEIMKFFGNPLPKIDGQMAMIRHQSPITRIQDSEEVLSLQQYVQFIGQLPPEVQSIAMNYAKISPYLMEKLHIPTSLDLTQDERNSQIDAIKVPHTKDLATI